MNATRVLDDLPATLPYSFARKNGVLLRSGPAGVECVHRAGAGLDALLEVQRVAPGASYVAVSDEAFDAALGATYSGGAGAAADFDLGDMPWSSDVHPREQNARFLLRQEGNGASDSPESVLPPTARRWQDRHRSGPHKWLMRLSV